MEKEKRLPRFHLQVLLFFWVFFIAVAPLQAEPIKVGVLLPLSGRLYELGGEAAFRSFLMAARELSAQEVIAGNKIEWIPEDTYGDRDLGMAAMEKLVEQDGVQLVTGGFSSTVTWAASEIAQEHEVPFLVSTASADRITEADRDYVFRLSVPASEQNRALESFLGNVAKVRTAAIIYENSFFGKYFSRKAGRHFREMGLDLLAMKSFPPGGEDFRILLSLLVAVKPDLVYIVARVKEARRIMQQAREVSLNPKLFLGHEKGFAIPEFADLAGRASDFVYSPVIWSPNLPYPGAREFYERYLETYGIPPDYHGAQAYAAVQVIVDAAARAEKPDRRALRESLSRTQMMTVLGPVRFLSYGKKSRQNRLPTYLMQWIDSELKPVWPPGIATDKYVYPTPRWDQRIFKKY